MAILSVGAGKQYSSVSAAVAASRDGDVVQVQAGTYTNDFVTVNTKISLQGVGGMVNMVATASPPDGKAIMTTNTDVTVDHFAFSGAKVPDGNGAGIRYQQGALTITNSYFHDNQNGLLSNASAGSITIKNSEFARNGTGDGYTHNLYVGIINTLTIVDSYFHDSVVGNEIKSRALNTTITGTRIAEGPEGTGSYSIDLPVGGRAVIKGNVIEQGPKSQNPAIIHFGGEGTPHASSSLEVSGNTVVNDLASPSTTLLLNQTSILANVSSNSVFGLTAAQITSPGGATVSGTTFLSSAPSLDTSSPWSAVAAPTFPAPSTPPAPTPTTTNLTVGSGSDTILLKVSEDAWNGDAQYTVKVDGVQVGGTFTAKAAHAAGVSDTLTLKGNWGTAAHKVEVTFTNDGWGGTADTDRNLYVDGLSYNGQTVPITSNVPQSGGTAQFSVPSTAAPTPKPTPTSPVTLNSTVGSGPDVFTLKVSEQAYNGDAQYTVRVDGVQIGGTLTAKADHSLGLSDVVTVKGTWGTAAHKVEVTFLNDDWGGTADADRNLYLDGVSYNGVAVASSSQALMSAGTAQVTVPSSAPPAPAVANTTAGSGPDKIVLKVSEDAWNGDAQYTVKVDGVQIGGTFTAKADHDLHVSDTLTLLGTWGTAAHKVEVNFLNDSWGGTADTDRNLYVDGLSYNGQAVTLTSNVPKSGGAVVFGVAATTAPAPPTGQGTTVGTGSNTLVLKVSEDAYQGDAQYTVRVDGQQVGGVFTATASHGAGLSEQLTFKGDWGAGVHTVSIAFLNDRWDGTAATDRNLYIDSLSYDGQISGGRALMDGAAATFTVGSLPTVASTLRGSSAADVLIGGAGNDLIVGGAGADQLTGGAGADRFQYTAISDSTAAAPDQIIDFVKFSDLIDLRAIDANPGVSGDQAFAFLGETTSFSGGGQGSVHIEHGTNTTKVMVDSGNGGAAEMVIQINAWLALTASDFVL